MSCLGSNLNWHEFLYENIRLMAPYPHILNPNFLKTEVILFQHSIDSPHSKLLEIAWQKFKIHFVFNMQRKIPSGVGCRFWLC